MFSSNTYQTSPDHIYMDLTISNSGTNTDALPQFLQFSATRDIPILDNCNEWNMSIIKFTLGTGSLPLMIVPIQTGNGNTNVNLTPYSITLSYAGLNYQAFLIFKPQNLYAPIPAKPKENQDLSTEYYWLNSYEYFISLINTTFQTAYDGLKQLGLIQPFVVQLPTTLAPYMEYNPNQASQVAILNADVVEYTPPISGDYIKIYFNNQLYSLFNSFTAFNYGNSALLGMNYRLNLTVLPNNGNIFTVGSPSVSYAQLYQEYSTLGANTTPIASIVFCSNTIPISPTLNTQPDIYNGLPNESNQTANSGYSNIITDISVPVEFGWEYKNSKLLYVPTGEYRMISLSGQQALKSYDLAIYWRDHWGNSHPFLLNPNECSTLKIMFRAKKYT